MQRLLVWKVMFWFISKYKCHLSSSEINEEESVVFDVFTLFPNSTGTDPIIYQVLSFLHVQHWYGLTFL